MGIFTSKPASQDAPQKKPGATKKPSKPAKAAPKSKTSFREEDFDARLPLPGTDGYDPTCPTCGLEVGTYGDCEYCSRGI
ncbi:hypothetical protein DL546_007568 [Coniochaeta pulveracea]|uniref:Uncharacterized protein n=1 Tax=Coniochaeta pulveracea TaxID=177199 RepID=A0A420YBN9_9PEZI|nr:hypothetical protein DL546_007568 [Coniochaeta pulveracea]